MRLFTLVILWLTIWLLLGSQVGLAQSQPLPAAPSQTRPDSLASTDTAAALHRFLVARRGTRPVVLVGTGLVYGLGIVAGPDKYGTYDGPAIRMVVYTPFALAALLAELLYYGQYSRRQERRALQDWQNHRLSPNLRRRLKPSYFTAATTG